MPKTMCSPTSYQYGCEKYFKIGLETSFPMHYDESIIDVDVGLISTY